MAESIKTTVYLDGADYRKLKALAEGEGRSAAELVREAVKEYAERRAPRAVPRSIGAFRSGRRDLADRADELLDGFGGDH